LFPLGWVRVVVKPEIGACHRAERPGWNVTKNGRRSSSSSVVILSYSQYCRYRAVQRRLETVPASGGCDLNDTILQAIGRPASVDAVARVMFCRSTFCHPDLDEHEFRRDLLSTSVSLSWAWPNSSGGGAVLVFIWLEARLQPNFVFTLRCVLAVYIHIGLL